MEWVSGHINIRGNKLADKAAKKETELQYVIPESYVSLTFIKRKIKETDLTDWNEIWSNSKLKNKHYT